ncbi:MAG: hypothetical protein D6683_08560, partial [Actinomyces sp.]
LDRVDSVTPTPPADLAAGIDAVVDELAPTVVKTGLLPGADSVGVVADRLRRLGTPLVVDPVLVTGTGRRLGDDEHLEAVRALVAGATVATPNREEAALLVGLPAGALDDVDAVVAAAGALANLGAGHLVVTRADDGVRVGDVVVTDAGVEVITGERIDSPHVRGTGCSFAAAVAAGLAHGAQVGDAITTARAWVRDQLATTRWSGPGRGPLQRRRGPAGVSGRDRRRTPRGR